MPAENPQPLRRRAAALPGLDPMLERTLVAAGWRPEDLRSPVRSPLADLRVTDLAASLVSPAPGGGWQTLATAADPADPNDTRLATDWSWLDALAAMSGSDPEKRLVTPGRLPKSSAANLERTRIAPWRASDLLPPAVATDVAQPEAPAQVAPELPQAPEVPARPALVPGVQLLGVMRDTGFAEQQWLAQRGPDFVQLSELLYRVLEQVDGARTLEEIAARARETTGRPVSANNVRLLIAARLLPLGLIVPVDGVVATAPSIARSPLQITLRLGLIGPGAIEPFARVLQVFFWPPLLVALIALIALSQAWLLHDAAAILRGAAADPLLAFVLAAGSFVFGSFFHEFGHASALRYGGGRARGMGFGIYYIYPAFYTDCTESYRLGRWGRMRVDLGGVYFDLLTALALVAAYAWTRQVALLAGALAIDWEILDQFSPVMRYDGYWALADLVGVPDFYSLLRPVLASAFAPLLRRFSRTDPQSAQRPAAPVLKGWVRVVFLAYFAVALPVLAIFFAVLVGELPSILGIIGDGLFSQLVALRLPGQTTVQQVLTVGEILVALGFAATLVYGFVSLVRWLVRSAWKWGAASRERRILSLAMLATGVVVLALVWRGQLEALIPHFAALIQLARLAGW